LKALGPLAVAQRHIRALGTTRADRGRWGDSARFARRHRPSPFQSAKDKVSRTGRPDVERSVAGLTDFVLADWKGEAGSRAEGRSRLSGPYSSECGAVRVFEREYPGQRPRARRGLPSHEYDRGCGDSLNSDCRIHIHHPFRSDQ